MTTLPLTVLGFEGPIFRAYLCMMRRAGFRPGRILLMVLNNHPKTGKPIAPWLPRPMRMKFAMKTQELALNFWPRRIARRHTRLLDAMTDRIGQVYDQSGALVEEMLGRFPYEGYTEELECVFVRGLGDDALQTALSKLDNPTVLYTGGGIVPTHLLKTPGLRFLHVHPGVLPSIRGADGLLWSTLVRSRPGASCFYMAPGIDVGDVIDTTDYPSLEFDISSIARPDDQTLYRAVFSYYDPILRADMLVRRVLNASVDLNTLPTVRQDPSEGLTYHFMHSSLRRKALQLLFRSKVTGESVGRSRASVCQLGCHC